MREDRKEIAAVARMALPAIVGAAVGFWFHAALDRPVPVPPGASRPLPSVLVTNSLDDAKANEVIGYLRGRVADLEQKLASRSATRSGEEAGPAVPVRLREKGEMAPGRTPAERRQDYLERLRKEDPARYDEIRRRIGEFRKQAEEAGANRREFFASIDTSRMTPAQRASHKRLLEASAKMEGYRARFASDSAEPMTEAERRDYFETRARMGELLEGERRYVLEALGSDYGEDGEAFADYIEAVFDYMSLRPFGRRGKGELR